MRLVLWDIDRTLLYVGDFDRSIYGEVFFKLFERDAAVFPPKGSGRTQPLLIRDFFLLNSVPADEADAVLPRAVVLVAERFAAQEDRMREEGVVYPGAVAALKAVAELPGTVATVLTGNLSSTALVKLRVFDLVQYVDVTVGGYSSDDTHRPSLVSVAQQRAAERYGIPFDRRNSIIIGDSVEDVVTGRDGGARVLAVASGTYAAGDLLDAGADLVIESLVDTDLVIDGVKRLTA